MAASGRARAESVRAAIAVRVFMMRSPVGGLRRCQASRHSGSTHHWPLVLRPSGGPDGRRLVPNRTIPGHDVAVWSQTAYRDAESDHWGHTARRPTQRSVAGGGVGVQDAGDVDTPDAT